jgi:prepilin peptidase dependent protein A/type IV fimbrial biogenesis protein FimT
MYFQRGVSLLEMMITVSIIAIVVAVQSPSVITMQRSLQLKGALENTYFAFQQARSSAVSSGNDITVDINSGANWCIALSDSGACDCATANSCTVDGVEQIVRSSDYSLITMQDLNFGANNNTVFDSVQGLSLGNAGSIALSDGTNQGRIALNNMGRSRICVQAGEIGGYAAC